MPRRNVFYKVRLPTLAATTMVLTTSACMSADLGYDRGIETVAEARSACSQAAFNKSSQIGPTEIVGIETVDFEGNDFEVLGYTDIKTGPRQSLETLFTCTVFDGRIRDVFIEGAD